MLTDVDFVILHCKAAGGWSTRGPCPREWEEEAPSPVRRSRLGLFVQEGVTQTRIVPGGGRAVNRPAPAVGTHPTVPDVAGAPAAACLAARCPGPVVADVRAVAAVLAAAGSAWAPASPLKPPTHT